MDIFMDFLKAFVVGGLICLTGQILIDKTKLTPGRILTLYVVAGAALGALGLYGRLVDFAGAGATTPLTGFGNALIEGVRQAVKNHGFFGIVTGGMSATAAGVTVAIAGGVLCSLAAKRKSK